MRTQLRFRVRLAALLLGSALLAGCAPPGPPTAAEADAAQANVAEARRALAPTGALRIAAYPGSR